MSMQALVPLGTLRRGARGRVAAIDTRGASGTSLSPEELERRLLEFGVMDGAMVEVLHEGLIGHDPLAVRVEQAVVALRRQEAMAILLVVLA